MYLTHPRRRLVDRSGLAEMGIGFSSKHLRRLIQANKFPAPIKIGLGRNAWILEEVENYIADSIRARDAANEGTL
jgi:predicted DNA-binding transcriptional regulator AlpA